MKFLILVLCLSSCFAASKEDLYRRKFTDSLAAIDNDQVRSKQIGKEFDIYCQSLDQRLGLKQNGLWGCVTPQSSPVGPAKPVDPPGTNTSRRVR